MKKKCELCKKPARMYCHSDKAALCWACDSRVHTANFIVAKHTRTLLCNSCQAPTPWTSSGPKLGPTATLCGPCTVGKPTHDTRNGEFRTSGNNEVEESGDCVSDDGGENQVVPLSLTLSLASTTTAGSCGFSSSRLGFDQ